VKETKGKANSLNKDIFMNTVWIQYQALKDYKY